jgi:hypothetical protein
MDLKFAIYVVWGLGTVVVYGIVLRKRRRSYRLHHDARSRRDLISGLALFITSLCSFLAITFVLFGEPGTGIRGLFAATALGAYLGAGIVMASEENLEAAGNK